MTSAKAAQEQPTSIAAQAADTSTVALIEQEIVGLQAVHDALEAEQQALEARDAEALTAASMLKLQRIEAAQLISAQRASAAPDAAALSSNPAAARQFEALVKLAGECKAKNEQNGLMINVQRRYLEQTLAVLRNETTEPPLYGPGGDSRRAGRRRGVLGSA